MNLYCLDEYDGAITLSTKDELNVGRLFYNIYPSNILKSTIGLNLRGLTLEINRLITMERKIGHGTVLMTKIAEIAKDRNIDHCLVDARPDCLETMPLKDLINFYSKFGFRPLKIKKENCLMIWDVKQKYHDRN